MFIHVLFLFPETAGKTLEQTEAMFTDPSGPRYIGVPAWKTRIVTKETLRMERGLDDESKLAAMAEHDEHSPERLNVTGTGEKN